MEARHFDRLTRTVGAAGTRRGALAGLAAGTAALVGRGRDGRAQKRDKKRKKCTFWPQRACCACRAEKSGPPPTCFTMEGLSQAEAQTRCTAACGGSDLLYDVQGPSPGAVHSCHLDLVCQSTGCPIPVKA